MKFGQFLESIWLGSHQLPTHILPPIACQPVFQIHIHCIWDPDLEIHCIWDPDPEIHCTVSGIRIRKYIVSGIRIRKYIVFGIRILTLALQIWSQIQAFSHSCTYDQFRKKFKNILLKTTVYKNEDGEFEPVSEAFYPIFNCVNPIWIRIHNTAVSCHNIPVSLSLK